MECRGGQTRGKSVTIGYFFVSLSSSLSPQCNQWTVGLCSATETQFNRQLQQQNTTLVYLGPDVFVQLKWRMHR